MFCPKCGNELNDSANFCRKCGLKIQKGTQEINKANVINSIKNLIEEIIKGKEDLNKEVKKENYLFLNNINSNYRKKLDKILNILIWIVGLWVILSSIIHIKSELDEAQNYKFILYVIRYIYAIGPLYLIDFILQEMTFILNLKYDSLKESDTSGVVCIGEVIYVILGIVSGILILYPSNAEMLNLYLAVVDGSLIVVLSTIKVPILLLVSAGILKYFISEKYLVEEK